MQGECKARRAHHWGRHLKTDACVDWRGPGELFDEMDRLRQYKREIQANESSLMAQLARFFPDRPPASVGLGIDRLIAIVSAKDAEILQLREECDDARFRLKVLEDRVRLVRGMLGDAEEDS